jgi:hypothetical protein
VKGADVHDDSGRLAEVATMHELFADRATKVSHRVTKAQRGAIVRGRSGRAARL